MVVEKNNKVEDYKFKKGNLNFAVVGHVEWINFLKVDQLPKPGVISHSEKSLEYPAGGGSIIAKKLSDLTSIAAKYDHIILYCHISDICPDAFIRSDKILRAYSGMLKYIQNSIDSRSQYIDIKEDRIEKDRTQLIFNMKNKNSKNILLIDSLRMLVKKKPLISQDFINACFLQIQ